MTIFTHLVLGQQPIRRQDLEKPYEERHGAQLALLRLQVGVKPEDALSAAQIRVAAKLTAMQRKMQHREAMAKKEAA